MTFRIIPHAIPTQGWILIAFMSLLLAMGLLTGPTAQASRTGRVSMSGENLDLAIPCTGEVRIIVDPTMKDGATLDSSNTAKVTMRTGKNQAENRIAIATQACAPHGRLTISISPITGLSIHDSADTRFIITGTLASLDASLDSNRLDIANVQSLDLSLRGASSVHVGVMERAAQVSAAGSSSLTVDQADLTAFLAQLSDTATLALVSGSVEALTVVASDSASATIHGKASTATITTNGNGKVSIAQVTGPMNRSGTGSINVGQAGNAGATEDASPTGNTPHLPVTAPPPTQAPNTNSDTASDTDSEMDSTPAPSSVTTREAEASVASIPPQQPVTPQPTDPPAGMQAPDSSPAIPPSPAPFQAPHHHHARASKVNTSRTSIPKIRPPDRPDTTPDAQPESTPSTTPRHP